MEKISPKDYFKKLAFSIKDAEINQSIKTGAMK